jgi:hypothetical protein
VKRLGTKNTESFCCGKNFNWKCVTAQCEINEWSHLRNHLNFLWGGGGFWGIQGRPCTHMLGKSSTTELHPKSFFILRQELGDCVGAYLWSQPSEAEVGGSQVLVLFQSCYPVSLRSWYRVLCSPGWPQILDPPASILESSGITSICTTMPGFFEILNIPCK